MLSWRGRCLQQKVTPGSCKVVDSLKRIGTYTHSGRSNSTELAPLYFCSCSNYKLIPFWKGEETEQLDPQWNQAPHLEHVKIFSQELWLECPICCTQVSFVLNVIQQLPPTAPSVMRFPISVSFNVVTLPSAIWFTLVCGHGQFRAAVCSQQASPRIWMWSTTNTGYSLTRVPFAETATTGEFRYVFDTLHF